MSKDWQWLVRGYYNDTVKLPRTPGKLAIEVGGMTRNALDMDILALKSRKDIGKIIIVSPSGSESPEGSRLTSKGEQTQ